jgi:ABC-type transport system substrate-binding protein
VERLLVEQVGFGADGGVYRSPFGTLALDDTGRGLSLTLAPANGAKSDRAAVTADSLSRFILSLADADSPRYRSDFASLLVGVSIAPDRRVQLDFARAHVRPDALLQHPISSANGSQLASRPGGEFSIAEHTADRTIFAVTDQARGDSPALHAIVEQTMADDETAIEALIAGEIDVLDRVPPWQADRLRAVENVRVASYRLPTVHVLIPNYQRALLAKREFRRALCYGIDRQWIVKRVLLGGATAEGFEALSGPFPVGVSLSDPVRYGHNSQIEPRQFEPRLAAILATIAWASTQPASEKPSTEPPSLPELVLAYPRDPLARIACQSIEAQLERAGIPIRLEEFSADEMLAGRVEFDLRYAELAVWEPLTDARRILGPGAIGDQVRNPYVDAALRKLDVATNWNDVRSRLAALHEIVHHELPVIPLWQTVNYFACSSSVAGIGESPLTLYQNIEDWRLTTGGNVARLERGK